MSPSATNGERKSVEALAEEFLDRRRRARRRPSKTTLRLTQSWPTRSSPSSPPS